MKLSRALRLTNSAVVAITAPNTIQLARELAPAIIATNTHFDKKQAVFADWHIIWEVDTPSPEMESRLWTGLTLISGSLDGERYRGISPTQMDALRALSASRNIPLLIATETGQPLPKGIRRIAVLEQAQADELPNDCDSVVIASSPYNYTVREPIAGIILAAGESTRFGSPKQLLDYHGQPFVRHVAQTALDAGLAPVIVVSGAYADLVEAGIQDLSLLAIRNQAWQDGQSSSIRAGISAIAETNVGGAVLFVADQPQVTVHVIGALVERHATEGAAITAPLAADRRTNPILFDRDTFADLLALTGDVGGRAIFSNYKVDYIPWHDESLLFDVDTTDDYRKLLAWGVED